MLFKHTLHYGKYFASDSDGGGGAAADASGDSVHDGNESGGEAGAGPGDSDDYAELKATLDKERKAARDADKKFRDSSRDLKTIRDELNQLKNAGKTDEERREADLKVAQDAAKEAQDKATTAEQRLHDANARSAVHEAAAKANAASVRAVYALVRDGLEFNDDGEPTKVAALIAQAKKDEPSLFRASGGSADGAATGESGSKQDLNSLFRQMAGTR